MASEVLNWPHEGRPVSTEVLPSTRAGARRGRHLLAWAVGLLFLPLSILPFLAYARYDETGSLIALRLERILTGPPHGRLTGVDRATYAAGLRYRDAVVVLGVHRVLDSGAGDGSAEGDTLSAQRFADDVAMLAAAGFATVTPDAVAAWLAGRGRLPENAVLIALDDARVDTVLNAVPILQRERLVATVLSAGGSYEANPAVFASPEQVATLTREGFTVGAYGRAGHGTVTAADGDHAPFLAARRASDGVVESLDDFRARARGELLATRDDCGRLQGRPCAVLGWPFGATPGNAAASDDPEAAAAAVEQARALFPLGITAGDTDAYRLVVRGADPLVLPRLPLAQDWTPRELFTRLQVAIATSAPQALTPDEATDA